jgi:hypothetical protein
MCKKILPIRNSAIRDVNRSLFNLFRTENLTYNTLTREEKRSITERELALNGDTGPVRRPVWRLVEATYAR